MLELLNLELKRRHLVYIRAKSDFASLGPRSYSVNYVKFQVEKTLTPWPPLVITLAPIGLLESLTRLSDAVLALAALRVSPSI